MVVTSKNLKFTYWNARGIRNKKFEFFNFLLNFNIDVACISETKLNDNVRFSHIDFAVYRCDNLSGSISSGGVMILVKRTVKHQLMSVTNTGIIESIGISLEVSPGRTINVVSAYFTGSTGRHDYVKFRNDIRYLTSIQNVFVLGDLNSKHHYWKCHSENRAGRILFQEMNEGGFDVHFPVEFTYHPISRHRPSMLDLLVTNSSVPFSRPEVHNELSSDHLPVCFELLDQTMCSDAYQLTPCFSRANWMTFRNYLNRNIDLHDFMPPEDINTNDVDIMIDRLTSIINDATRLSVPMVKMKPSYVTMPDDLKYLIRLRRDLRRTYTRTRNVSLRPVINNIGHTISDKFRELHNDEYQRRISTLIPNEDNNRKLWNLTKVLKGRKKQIPTLEDDVHTYVTNQEKAEALASQFYANHTVSNNDPVPVVLGRDVRRACHDIESTLEYDHDQVPLTSPNEVKKLIRVLRNNKAPGEDGVRNICLKHVNAKFIVALTYIFNACLTLSYFPKVWKRSLTVPIHKPGKPIRKVSSYRPISLLSSMSKLFERIVLSRLNTYVSDHNLIPNEQFGFRSSHSPTHQVLRLMKHVKVNRSMKKSTGAVFLDMKCAFDSVWHDGLVFKLAVMGIPISLLKLVQSFLKDRKFCASLNGIRSVEMDVPAGVPQGAILSPLLFNLYLHDVPRSKNCHLAQYADDIAIYNSSRLPSTIIRNLQPGVNKIVKYCKKWRLKLNPTKTESVYFSRRIKNKYYPRKGIMVEGCESAWKSEARYLGVMLDKRLTFKKHVDHVIQRSGVCLKSIYSILNWRSRLNVRNKVLLYKMVIRPILLYACPAWGQCADTHLRRVQVTQNRFLKMCHSLPRNFPTHTLHDMSDIEPVKVFIARLRNKFISGCSISDNPLIASLP